jgi:hypothetical protein
LIADPSNIGATCEDDNCTYAGTWHDPTGAAHNRLCRLVRAAREAFPMVQEYYASATDECEDELSWLEKYAADIGHDKPVAPPVAQKPAERPMADVIREIEANPPKAPEGWRLIECSQRLERERDEARALLIAVYEFDVRGKPCDFAYIWARVREMMAGKASGGGA